MIEKITNSEFDVLSKDLEFQLFAVFSSMKDDILKYLDTIDLENEHDIINGINEIINGEVDYAKSDKR